MELRKRQVRLERDELANGPKPGRLSDVLIPRESPTSDLRVDSGSEEAQPEPQKPRPRLSGVLFG